MSHATLEHPLPAGMRDLLPPEAALRRGIARAFLGRAELFGYEAVSPPVFEYASTIERGLGTLDPREIVRFVEPETGEVVALRPDVTPQIARLVATRFEGKPPPYRLAYDASVLRRRVGSRARTHRQISQLGLELVGVSPLEGDVELVVLAASALQSLGLSAFTLDLGHADIARSLLSPNVGVDAARAEALADALAKKDVAEIARLAADLPVRDALVALADLHGPPSLLAALPAAIAESPARAAIEQLRALVSHLERTLEGEGVVAATVTVDLSEVRGLAYYTGPFYQFFAEGPGVAIGAGGRYDDLLARFDRPLPASGLALDVDALLWALRTAKAKILERARRVVVTGPHDAANAFARTLRAADVPAVTFEHASDRGSAEGGTRLADGAREWAQAWGYSHVARVDEHGGVALEPLDGAGATTLSREQALAHLSGRTASK